MRTVCQAIVLPAAPNLCSDTDILRVGAIEAALTPEAVEQDDHRFSRHLSISGPSQLGHEPSPLPSNNSHSSQSDSALERADAVGDTFGPRPIVPSTPNRSPEITTRTVTSSPASSYLRPSGPTPGARPGVPTPGSSVSTLSVYASSNVRGRDYGYDYASAVESPEGYTSAVETPGAYASAREIPDPYSSSRETPGLYASALETPGLYSGQGTPGPYVSARETPMQHTSAEDTDADGYFTADNTTELGHGLGNVDYFASDAYSTADETEMGSDELTQRFDMLTGPYRRSDSPVYMHQQEHRFDPEPEQENDSGGETEESVVRPLRDFSTSASPSLRRLSAMSGLSPLGARSSVSSGLVPPRSAHTERSRSSYQTNASSDGASRMSGLSDFPVPPDYAYDPRPSLESRPSIDADAESDGESDREGPTHSRTGTVRQRRTSSRARESIMNRF
ncbi:hypothetical protein PENSPDRAFT_191448 [Peniophora sp. CONT]|nr:hypothetical protein PENSPDRAFT_191448 [Peniophora sp. CONT]